MLAYITMTSMSKYKSVLSLEEKTGDYFTVLNFEYNTVPADENRGKARNNYMIQSPTATPIQPRSVCF